MYKMRFHWENGEKSGSFTVTSYSVDDCIKIAEEELAESGAELMDYYVV